MSTENWENADSLPAAGDYSAANTYRLVKIDTSGNIALCGAGGLGCVGVVGNQPRATEQGRYRRWGKLRCEVGATIATAGLELTSDTVGKLKPASSGDYVVGISRKGNAVGDMASFEKYQGVYLKP